MKMYLKKSLITMFVVLLSLGVVTYLLQKAILDYNDIKIKRVQCAKEREELEIYQERHPFKKAAFDFLSGLNFKFIGFLGYEEPDVHSSCSVLHMVEYRKQNWSLMITEQIFEEALDISFLKPMRGPSGEVLLTWRSLKEVSWEFRNDLSNLDIKHLTSKAKPYVKFIAGNVESFVLNYHICLIAAACMLTAVVVLYSSPANIVEEKKPQPEKVTLQMYLFVTMVFDYGASAIGSLIMGTNKEEQAIIQTSKTFICSVVNGVANTTKLWLLGKEPINFAKTSREQIVSGCVLMFSSLQDDIVGSPGVNGSSSITYRLVYSFLFLINNIIAVGLSYLYGEPLTNGFLLAVWGRIKPQLFEFVHKLAIQAVIHLIKTILPYLE